jgi:hypothetical protein
MDIDQEKYFGVTPEEFNEMHRRAVDYARMMIGCESEHVMPHLLVHYRDPDGAAVLALCAIAGDFNEGHEKQQVLEMIADKFCREKRPVRAAFLCCEAWMASDPGVQPRDAADKKECVIVVGADLRAKLAAGTIIPIRRGPGNVIISEPEMPQPDGIRLPILGLFFRAYINKVAAEAGGAASFAC